MVQGQFFLEGGGGGGGGGVFFLWGGGGGGGGGAGIFPIFFSRLIVFTFRNYYTFCKIMLYIHLK